MDQLQSGCPCGRDAAAAAGSGVSSAVAVGHARPEGGGARKPAPPTAVCRNHSASLQGTELFTNAHSNVTKTVCDV